MCGKTYDPADRVEAGKSRKVIPQACKACLKEAGYIDPEKKLYEDSIQILKIAQDFNLSPKDALAFWTQTMEVIRKRQESSPD
jgi:mannose/cellobiose epimerase-like protein (N-acyl-D-glucosamine 2-epimerase family)